MDASVSTLVVSWTQKIRGVESGGVEMPRGKTLDAEVLEADRQVFGSGRGVVREEKKRRPGGGQCLHKVRRAGNQLILAVDDAVHVNQVTGFHTSKIGLRCRRA